jgi:hypothetical protein
MTDRDHDEQPEPEERAPWDDDGVRGWQASTPIGPRPPARPAEPEPDGKAAETTD